MLSKKPLAGDRWLEFVSAIEAANAFTNLPQWVQTYIVDGEKEFGTNPAHSYGKESMSAKAINKFNENHDELGRFSSSDSSGLHATAKRYPAAEISAARASVDRLNRETRQLPSDHPDRIAAEQQDEKVYGRSTYEHHEITDPNGYKHWEPVETVHTPELTGAFRRETFETVDSKGQPTDPATRDKGADPQQYKLRDEYVVKDPQTLAMNRTLNAGRESTRADRIDQWVNSSTLKTDLIAYRGAAMPQEVADQLQPGATLQIGGYQSHDYSEKGAKFYLGVRMKDRPDAVPVMFENVITAGTHAADAGVQELVVQRNTNLEIVDRQMVDGYLHIKGVIRGN